MGNPKIFQLDIIGIQNIPDVQKGDNISEIILLAAKLQDTPIIKQDIIVVTQKIVSKSEGRIVLLNDVTPSVFAKSFAKSSGKDPRLIELILMESRAIVRSDPDRGILIAETEHGFVCANAGIDSSNIEADMVTLLPKNPDLSAKKIRAELEQKSGVSEMAVVISDTFGRPWREGQTNIAIGVDGMNPLMDYRGLYDKQGSMLTSTKIAVADEIAAAAELVMGKIRSIPSAIVRGFDYSTEKPEHSSLIRKRSQDLFR
jgi:coenzyme F420-0:L-glutamate ligase/coenzyme F420-1:gamma-L-glutamate ligase